METINLIAAVPEGMPGPEHFEVVAGPAPTLGDGILVELLTLSVRSLFLPAGAARTH